MKTRNYGSKGRWILLLVCLSSKLYSQSISVTASLDSARAEFLRNAKNINADLAKGDFARERETVYEATIASQNKAYEGLAGELGDCKKTAGSLAGTLFETKDKLGRETNKKGAARLENWLWRGAIILGIYAKIKGVL